MLCTLLFFLYLPLKHDLLPPLSYLDLAFFKHLRAHFVKEFEAFLHLGEFVHVNLLQELSSLLLNYFSSTNVDLEKCFELSFLDNVSVPLLDDGN